MMHNYDADPIGTYYMCGGQETHWRKINAATLHGAKSLAGRMYQYTAGGKAEIGQKVSEGRIEPVAVKRGFDAWAEA